MRNKHQVCATLWPQKVDLATYCGNEEVFVIVENFSEMELVEALLKLRVKHYDDHKVAAVRKIDNLLNDDCDGLKPGVFVIYMPCITITK